MKIRIKLQVVEYHTIEREVDEAEFRDAQKSGDPAGWLEREFQDTELDGDSYTESVDVHEWEEI